MKVKFNSRSNGEVRSIAEYYTREAGAERAREFLEELDAIIGRIKLSPQSFPSFGSNIRRAIFNKYPYIIAYEIESDDVIRILTVRHQKQNPDLGLR